MIVGEPSLMGGDFGEEDERLITRLENTQYDPMGQPLGPGMEAGDPSAPYQGDQFCKEAISKLTKMSNLVN